MDLKQHRRAIAIAAAIALLVAIPLIASRGNSGGIPITVQGQVHHVPPGTTVDGLIGQLHLRPASGNLLDVDGQILEKGAFPGRILVDGQPSRADAILSPGSVVQVVAGPNQTEALRHTTYTRTEGQIPNPQFSLRTSPGEEVVTVGAVSGKVVSAVFHPSGSESAPRAVALTFDDGPSPDYTAKIVALLSKYHVRATFFVVGVHAQQYPDLIRAEIRAGMTVASHSWDHPNSPPFAKLAPVRIRSEIERTESFLFSLGVVTAFFRPPGGSFSGRVVTDAAAVDSRVVLWDVDPQDWRTGRTARQIASSVLRAVQPGSIVELHDGGGNRSATLAALPAIIRGIQAAGLRLVPVQA